MYKIGITNDKDGSCWGKVYSEIISILRKSLVIMYLTQCSLIFFFWNKLTMSPVTYEFTYDPDIKVRHRVTCAEMLNVWLGIKFCSFYCYRIYYVVTGDGFGERHCLIRYLGWDLRYINWIFRSLWFVLHLMFETTLWIVCTNDWRIILLWTHCHLAK